MNLQKNIKRLKTHVIGLSAEEQQIFFKIMAKNVPTDLKDKFTE